MTSRRCAQPRAGQPGPAEHRVRPEEGHVHARVAGRGDVRPLRRRPVLVVAEREQRAGPVQQVRVGVDVHAGDVGERQAEALSQLDELPLVVQEHEGTAGVVGPVQADRQRAVAVIGDAAGAVVEVVAAPGVVGLPGLDPVLDHDLACGGGGPDGDGDEPLRARLGVQPQQVGAFRPAVRRHGEGRFPVGLHRVGRADEDRLALPVPRHGRRPPHQPGQVAAVPAHPERAHRERARGGGRIDRDRLTGQHAGLARVPEHRAPRAEVPDVPVGVTGERVLAHRPADRHRPRGPGRRRAARAGRPGARGGRRRHRRGDQAEEGPPRAEWAHVHDINDGTVPTAGVGQMTWRLRAHAPASGVLRGRDTRRWCAVASSASSTTRLQPDGIPRRR